MGKVTVPSPIAIGIHKWTTSRLAAAFGHTRFVAYVVTEELEDFWHNFATISFAIAAASGGGTELAT